jgi:hypothetical protein
MSKSSDSTFVDIRDWTPYNGMAGSESASATPSADQSDAKSGKFSRAPKGPIATTANASGAVAQSKAEAALRAKEADRYAPEWARADAARERRALQAAERARAGKGPRRLKPRVRCPDSWAYCLGPLCACREEPTSGDESESDAAAAADDGKALARRPDARVRRFACAWLTDLNPSADDSTGGLERDPHSTGPPPSVRALPSASASASAAAAGAVVAAAVALTLPGLNAALSALGLLAEPAASARDYIGRPGFGSSGARARVLGEARSAARAAEKSRAILDVIQKKIAAATTREQKANAELLRQHWNRAFGQPGTGTGGGNGFGTGAGSGAVAPVHKTVAADKRRRYKPGSNAAGAGRGGSGSTGRGAVLNGEEDARALLDGHDDGDEGEHSDERSDEGEDARVRRKATTLVR